LRSLSAAFFFFYSQALANFNGWIHLSFAMKDEAFHFLNRAHVFFSLFKRWIGGRGDWLVSAVANTKMVLYNSISGELRVVFGELDPDQTLYPFKDDFVWMPQAHARLLCGTAEEGAS